MMRNSVYGYNEYVDYDHDDYLAHYGVLGMHWGVRRYQNPDGTLTSRGKARLRKVAGDGKLAERQKKKAVKVLQREEKHNRRMYEQSVKNSKEFEKTSRLYEKKANKKLQSRKSREENRNLAYDYANKSEESKRKGREYLANANFLKEKISDVSSGKLKAGQDFIVAKILPSKRLIVAAAPDTFDYDRKKND